MRFRLRYLHHDIELSEGQFAVGRSTSCQLSLDDPLVSRRHALLRVERGQCYVEDLQSRNGVIVNNRRIVSPIAIVPGDRILIGAQELVLLGDRDVPDGPDPHVHSKHTLPKVEAASSTSGLGVEPRILPPRTALPRFDEDTDPSMVRRADAFRLLGRVAEKALALGRTDEAERLLATALTEVIESTRAGKVAAPALVDTAARFAAKLAVGTGRGAWVDYVIELYTAQRRPCPATVVDELYGALRRARGFDVARLRGYVAIVRELAPTYGPAERFLVQRIEGLERLASTL